MATSTLTSLSTQRFARWRLCWPSPSKRVRTAHLGSAGCCRAQPAGRGAVPLNDHHSPIHHVVCCLASGVRCGAHRAACVRKGHGYGRPLHVVRLCLHGASGSGSTPIRRQCLPRWTSVRSQCFSQTVFPSGSSQAIPIWVFPGNTVLEARAPTIARTTKARSTILLLKPKPSMLWACESDWW